MTTAESKIKNTSDSILTTSEEEKFVAQIEVSDTDSNFIPDEVK